MDIAEIIEQMINDSKYSLEELAQKLSVTSRTLRRYQKSERTMPVDLFWQLVLITKYDKILALMEAELNRYWHKRKSSKCNKVCENFI